MNCDDTLAGTARENMLILLDQITEIVTDTGRALVNRGDLCAGLNACAILYEIDTLDFEAASYRLQEITEAAQSLQDENLHDLEDAARKGELA